jgi:pimeloyl-ACP methyl ester carboxylesterase
MHRKDPTGSVDSRLLAKVHDKPVYYKNLGSRSGPPVVFVHGLGGSSEYYRPLIHSLDITMSHQLWVFDLEGHGLTPTSPLSRLSIESFAADLSGLFEVEDIPSNATIVAHSIGCLVAVKFALAHPEKVGKLILLGPPLTPLEATTIDAYKLADRVRESGIACDIDERINLTTSKKTKTSNPLAMAAIRMLLLGQDPEGYAKALTALGDAHGLDFPAVQATTLFVTGTEDYLSPPQLCEKFKAKMNAKASLRVLENVGHWHVFEDLAGVADVIRDFVQ